MTKNTKKPSSRHTSDMLLNDKTSFVIAEAYKTLRTNVMFAMTAAGDVPLKNVIVVSSSLPGEGKSITSANLAIAMAQMNSKVLLIDADLRKPVQNKFFETSNVRGLSTVLINETMFEVALKKEVRPGLDLLTSGKIPPNPSELLGSKAMKALLTQLSTQYDYIVTDTPPMYVVSDTLTFAVDTSGILLAVCPYICKHEHLKKTLENASLANINILGVFLSNTRKKSVNLPYSKKYYRSSYYKKYGY